MSAPATATAQSSRGAIEDAYAAGFAAGELAERNLCRWPYCTENEDEQCQRRLTGECAGPSTEFMP